MTLTEETVTSGTMGVERDVWSCPPETIRVVVSTEVSPPYPLSVSVRHSLRTQTYHRSLVVSFDQTDKKRERQ